MDLDMATQLMLAFGLCDPPKPERPPGFGLNEATSGSVGYTYVVEPYVPPTDLSVTVDTADLRVYSTSNTADNTLWDLWNTSGDSNDGDN